MEALDRRDRIAKASRVGVPLLVLALVALVVWRLASNTAGERREVPQVPVVALTPPPPPPPPQQKPPEPQKTVETPVPTPTPQPRTNAPEKPTAAPKALTINGPPQAGSDAFGVAAGRGGGVTVGGDPNGSDTPGGGGDFAAASYASYLKSALQQAVQADDRVSRMVFASVEVNVWIDAAGRITRVNLAKSSGDARTDRALVSALQQVGRLDEAPPPKLSFPAHVTLSGRRA